MKGMVSMRTLILSYTSHSQCFYLISAVPEKSVPKKKKFTDRQTHIHRQTLLQKRQNIEDSEQISHTPDHSYQRYGELILYMQISLTIAWERWAKESNLSILIFTFVLDYTTYFTIVRVYTKCEDWLKKAGEKSVTDF